jgi:hypothetical protein
MTLLPFEPSHEASAMAAILAGISGMHVLGAATSSPDGSSSHSEGAVFIDDGSGLPLFDDGSASGLVLTTGGLDCVGGQNTLTACTGNNVNGDGLKLQLTFTLDSKQLSFEYIFGSEEFENSGAFNDGFSMILNGANYDNVNLARLPNGGDINVANLNAAANAAFYRNNNRICDFGCRYQYDTQLNGLSTPLTASATNLVPGATYTLTLTVFDAVDNRLDSAVFIRPGRAGAVVPPGSGIPEPAGWAMMLAGFGIVGFSLRRRTTASIACACNLRQATTPSVTLRGRIRGMIALPKPLLWSRLADRFEPRFEGALVAISSAPP